MVSSRNAAALLAVSAVAAVFGIVLSVPDTAGLFLSRYAQRKMDGKNASDEVDEVTQQWIDIEAIEMRACEAGAGPLFSFGLVWGWAR